MFCATQKDFQVSDQNCLIWVVLSCNFEKLLAFDISTLEVVKTERFIEKKKEAKIGPKMP